jgi:hypothetical protein
MEARKSVLEAELGGHLYRKAEELRLKLEKNVVDAESVRMRHEQEELNTARARMAEIEARVDGKLVSMLCMHCVNPY